ncbi:MAG: hypothetical protein NVS4B1_35360 [Ktedonobacteraceae bacterium]
MPLDWGLGYSPSFPIRIKLRMVEITMREKQVVGNMTGASPVTPIDGVAWLCHAVANSRVVTGLAPVMHHPVS